MNKQLLLTAFAITAVMSSNNATPINPNDRPKAVTYKEVIENNLQEERKLFQAADDAAREAWAASNAADTKLADAAVLPDVNQSEIDTLLKQAQEARRKWESAEKARKDIRNNRPSSLDPYFKKEKSSSKSTTTDETISSIKAIAAKKWVKRTAYVLIACTIYTVLFSGNNRSDGSDDQERD